MVLEVRILAEPDGQRLLVLNWFLNIGKIIFYTMNMNLCMFYINVGKRKKCGTVTIVF